MSSILTHSEAGKLGYLKCKPIWDAKRRATREAYARSPSLCGFCLTGLPFERKRNKFCSHSCAAKKHNAGCRKHGHFAVKPCVVCQTPTKNPKFCSKDCETSDRKAKLLASIQAGTYTKVTSGNKILKRYLVNARGAQCEKCKNTHWLSEPIALTTEHIDGNAGNNRPDNLLLLCWNCHAQTKTFGRKNYGKSARVNRYKTKQQ
jgi:hypothetical protein